MKSAWSAEEYNTVSLCNERRSDWRCRVGSIRDPCGPHVPATKKVEPPEVYTPETRYIQYTVHTVGQSGRVGVPVDPRPFVSLRDGGTVRYSVGGVRAGVSHHKFTTAL